MRDLKALREDWEDKQIQETKLLSNLTIQESARDFFSLYQTFAIQLKETEAVFGPERRAYLAEFQNRLQRIAEWQKINDREFMAERHPNSETLK